MASLSLADISAHRTHQAIASCAGSLSAHPLTYFHQPNWPFNADANTGHAFGILMACVGTLRPVGLRRRLTL